MAESMRPAPHLAVQGADELHRGNRTCPSNELPYTPDETDDIALRRLDQELAFVLAYVGTEKVEPSIDVRDLRLLRRETQTPFCKESRDCRENVLFQQFTRVARNDKVISKANRVHFGAAWSRPPRHLLEPIQREVGEHGGDGSSHTKGNLLPNRGSGPGSLVELSEQLARRDDLELALLTLQTFYRDLAVTSLGVPADELGFSARREELDERAGSISPSAAAARVSLIHECVQSMRQNANRQVALDSLLFDLRNVR